MTAKKVERSFDRKVICIPASTMGSVVLQGELTLPENPRGLVLFSHGDGLLKPDNVYLSHILNSADYATLLVDLLTLEEADFDEVTSELRADFVTLGQRLVDIAIWIEEQRELRPLNLGILSDGVGATAALITAARLPKFVRSVVCLSADLKHAAAVQSYVTAPTLFIVGESDPSRASSEEFAAGMQGECQVRTVPGETAVLATPGEELNKIAGYVVDWFQGHMKSEEASALVGATDQL